MVSFSRVHTVCPYKMIIMCPPGHLCDRLNDLLVIVPDLRKSVVGIYWVRLVSDLGKRGSEVCLDDSPGYLRRGSTGNLEREER